MTLDCKKNCTASKNPKECNEACLRCNNEMTNNYFNNKFNEYKWTKNLCNYSGCKSDQFNIVSRLSAKSKSCKEKSCSIFTDKAKSEQSYQTCINTMKNAEVQQTK